MNFRIQKAAGKTGRSDKDIRLVAVTKTVSVERIREAAQAGIKEIGESKIQEAGSKFGSLQEFGLTTHLIGHLQRNKARRAAELFDVVQSVDSESLAQTLDRVASERGKKQACLIEVKISIEPSKTGVPFDQAAEFIKEFSRFKNLNLKGLMTIGPYGISMEETRSLFKKFSQFFYSQESYFGENPVLSMGMSDDFEMAIEEGSNLVRIGRALFGERKI